MTSFLKVARTNVGHVLGFALLALTITSPAHADLAGVVTGVTQLITSGLVTAIAILVVTVTGIAWMLGRFDPMKLAMIVAGACLISGAASIGGALVSTSTGGK